MLYNNERKRGRKMKKIVIKVAVIFINFVVILAFASNMAEAKNNIEKK